MSRPMRGFTLVELLIASTLMALLIMGVSAIFSTSLGVVNQNQGHSEMSWNLAMFADRLRADVQGIDHDGVLMVGARRFPIDQPATWPYGSTADKAKGLNQNFRFDWMWFFMGTENRSGVDPRNVSQFSRVFYGHGPVTNPRSVIEPDFDPANWGSSLKIVYSDLATNWVLMRNLVNIVPTFPLYLASLRTSTGVYGSTGQADVAGLMRLELAKNPLRFYTERDPYWYRFRGDGKYTNRVPEPEYYHNYAGTLMASHLWPNADVAYGDTANYIGRGLHALPHCAEFKIQYAMRSDLGAGAGGSVRWQDPPYYDVTAASPDQTGTRRFLPGDEWPVLLRITARVFDVLDRIEGDKKVEIVVAVP